MSYLEGIKSRLRKVEVVPESTSDKPPKTQSEINSTPADKKFFKDGVENNISYDFCWIKGKRPTMEDEHLACSLSVKESDEQITLFGIFDGHGTSAVSKAIALWLPKIFEKHLKQRDSDTTEKKISEEKKVEKMKELITDVFKEADANLLKVLTSEETCGGSTASVAIFTDKKVYCAHLGDSRTLIWDNSEEKKEIYNSTDHKPTNPIEAKRIEKAGGKVFYGRITTERNYGGLAVSRAFGDFQYKKLHDKDSNPESVSMEPEIEVFDLDKIGGICIMCDGVTDVLTNSEDIKKIYFEDGSEAKDLVMKAYEEGSLDNISAVFINKGNW